MDRGRDAVARQTRELSTTLKPIRCPPVDDLTPAEIAPLLEERGVAKATASISTTFVLGVPAGAVIALGAVVSALVATESPLGYARRVSSGLAFSLVLIMVIGGGELFTADTLITMSRVSRHISLERRNMLGGAVLVASSMGSST